MADLVSVSQMVDFLGLESDDENLGLAAQLADEVEAKFEAACGRSSRPFTKALTGRVERRDSTNRKELYVDYPIASLTSVKLGNDPSVPDEALAVADKNVVQWVAGSRRISRVDGGVFGCAGRPLYVQVTYNTQDDLPQDVLPALKRGVAIIYNQRGSEDVKAESVGGYQADVAVLDEDPEWKSAVERHREVLL